MEATETVLTPEEANAQIVARYKAFLKRRAEEHAKDDADPARQKRIIEASEKLKKQNEEEGTPIVTIPTDPRRDEQRVPIRYRFASIL